MAQIPEGQGGPLSGAIGVLLLYTSAIAGNFTDTWQHGLSSAGHRVRVPLLLVTGESWGDVTDDMWRDWLSDAEDAFADLNRECENIFIVGIESASALALRLTQIHAGSVDGVVLISPSLPRETRKLKKLWNLIREELYFIDHPIFLTHATKESDASSADALIIANSVSSPLIREILLDEPLAELSLIAGEVETFIAEVVHGFWHHDEDSENSDESELIDAEFAAIVAGLSLDESSPSTYLDELDREDPEEHFAAPDPELLPIAHRGRRNAIFAMVVGPVYAIAAALAGFDPFGVEPWPGLLAFIGGLTFFFLSLQEERRDDDDGAIL